MDFYLVVPDSTHPLFVNSQLVSLQLVGVFNKFLVNLQILFFYFSVHSFAQKCLTLRHLLKLSDLCYFYLPLSIITYRNAKPTLPGKSLKYVLKTDDHDDCGWQLNDILMICKDNHSKRMSFPLIALHATAVT